MNDKPWSPNEILQTPLKYQPFFMPQTLYGSGMRGLWSKGVGPQGLLIHAPLQQGENQSA